MEMALEADHQHHFHVLAVDDSLIDRKLLEKLLKISSYKVTCVESGSKALEYLGLPDNMENSSSCSSFTNQQREVNVNLIITDYCMPGMTGYDLLTRVKKSSWKDVPVVVMSSENVPSRINRCLEGGAEEFLLKPVQLSDMKKLHPHLLKSLNCSSSTITNNNNISNNNSNRNNEDNNNSGKSISNSSSNNSKRKAMSPPPERRTKFRGLTLLS